VLIMATLAIAWRRWLKSGRQDASFHPLLPSLLFGFVCLQGAFGAWTVTLKLQPVIVTTHLLLGMLLLSLLTWLGVRQNRQSPNTLDAAQVKVLATFAMVLVFIQIALGGWVSTNYAALACTDFPTCHGALLPEMDLANGFSLWRELGKTIDGEFLPFPALTAIHWVHRMFAFIVISFVAWLAFTARRIDGLHVTARWLLIVIAMQFITGVSTIFLAWPLAIAVAHNGGAAALVLLLTMLNYQARNTVQAAPNRAATRLSPA
jgi:cytochrome c oxidase assembly protein subunit 15